MQDRRSFRSFRSFRVDCVLGAKRAWKEVAEDAAHAASIPDNLRPNKFAPGKEKGRTADWIILPACTHWMVKAFCVGCSLSFQLTAIAARSGEFFCRCGSLLCSVKFTALFFDHVEEDDWSTFLHLRLHPCKFKSIQELLQRNDESCWGQNATAKLLLFVFWTYLFLCCRFSLKLTLEHNCHSETRRNQNYGTCDSL